MARGASGKHRDIAWSESIPKRQVLSEAAHVAQNQKTPERSNRSSRYGSISKKYGLAYKGKGASIPQRTARPQPQSKHEVTDFPIPANHVKTIVQAYGSGVDLYDDVLKIDRCTSQKAIRIAYFRRGRQVLNEPSAGQTKGNQYPATAITSQMRKLRFQAVSMAYEILSNPDWKKCYDEQGLVPASTVSSNGNELSSENTSVPSTPLGQDSTVAGAGPSCRTVGKGIVDLPKAPPTVLRRSSLSQRVRHSKLRNTSGAPNIVSWNEEVEELIFDQDADELSFKSGCDATSESFTLKKLPPRKKKTKRRILVETAELGKHLKKLDSVADSIAGVFDELEASFDGMLGGFAEENNAAETSQLGESIPSVSQSLIPKTEASTSSLSENAVTVESHSIRSGNPMVSTSNHHVMQSAVSHGRHGAESPTGDDHHHDELIRDSSPISTEYQFHNKENNHGGAISIAEDSFEGVASNQALLAGVVPLPELTEQKHARLPLPMEARQETTNGMPSKETNPLINDEQIMQMEQDFDVVASKAYISSKKALSSKKRVVAFSDNVDSYPHARAEPRQKEVMPSPQELTDNVALVERRQNQAKADGYFDSLYSNFFAVPRNRLPTEMTVQARSACSVSTVSHSLNPNYNPWEAKSTVSNEKQNTKGGAHQQSRKGQSDSNQRPSSMNTSYDSSLQEIATLDSTLESHPAANTTFDSSIEEEAIEPYNATKSASYFNPFDLPIDAPIEYWCEMHCPAPMRPQTVKKNHTDHGYPSILDSTLESGTEDSGSDGVKTHTTSIRDPPPHDTTVVTGSVTLNTRRGDESTFSSETKSQAHLSGVVRRGLDPVATTPEDTSLTIDEEFFAAAESISITGESIVRAETVFSSDDSLLKADASIMTKETLFPEVYVSDDATDIETKTHVDSLVFEAELIDLEPSNALHNDGMLELQTRSNVGGESDFLRQISSSSSAVSDGDDMKTGSFEHLISYIRSISRDFTSLSAFHDYIKNGIEEWIVSNQACLTSVYISEEEMAKVLQVVEREMQRTHPDLSPK